MKENGPLFFQTHPGKLGPPIFPNLSPYGKDPACYGPSWEAVPLSYKAGICIFDWGELDSTWWGEIDSGYQSLRAGGEGPGEGQGIPAAPAPLLQLPPSHLPSRLSLHTDPHAAAGPKAFCLNQVLNYHCSFTNPFFTSPCNLISYKVQEAAILITHHTLQATTWLPCHCSQPEAAIFDYSVTWLPHNAM